MNFKKTVYASGFCCVQDLAQYVNEVKRDNETLREIDQYQKSIENLVSRAPYSKLKVDICLF